MLKAVRFDEDKHKHLLDYIVNYTDNKGKKNESEAIRFLMQIGFDLLNKNIEPTPEPPPQPKLPDIKSTLNIDELKKELLNEIMSQVNTQTINSLNTIVDKLNNFQPTVVIEPQFTKVNTQSDELFTKVNTTEHTSTIPKPDIPKPKPVEIPADANGLLANLIGNANR